MNIKYIARKRGEGKTQRLIEILEKCANAGIPCVVYHKFPINTDDFIHRFIDYTGKHPSTLNIKFANEHRMLRGLWEDGTTLFVDNLSINFPFDIRPRNSNFTIITTIDAEDVGY